MPALRIEPCPKRVRCYLAGQLVADTIHPVLVWEGPHYPVYYLPAADIRAELVPAGRTDHSPSRGDAEILDVKVASATAVGGALRYPQSRLPELRGLVRLEWDSMSEWLEQDVPGAAGPGLPPPPHPLHRGGHPADPPPHRGEPRRGPRRRLPPAPHPVRDRAAAPLLPAPQ